MRLQITAPTKPLREPIELKGGDLLEITRKDDGTKFHRYLVRDNNKILAIDPRDMSVVNREHVGETEKFLNFYNDYDNQVTAVYRNNELIAGEDVL